jgi:hypothetical protein
MQKKNAFTDKILKSAVFDRCFTRLKNIDSHAVLGAAEFTANERSLR